MSINWEFYIENFTAFRIIKNFTARMFATTFIGQIIFLKYSH